MMESSNGMSQGFESNAQPGGQSTTPAASSHVQSTAPVHTPEERLLKQSEVNDIVKTAKYKAVEDYKRLQSEQPAYFEKKYGESASQTQPSVNPSQSFNDDHFRRIAEEAAQRVHDSKVQEYRANVESDNAKRIAQGFIDKFVPGRDKYQDFDSVVGDHRNYGKFPNVVTLLSQYVDNAHDVLYELRKNGDVGRLVNLEMTAERYPDEALMQVQRLSQSIKDNEAAGKIKIPNAPLNQLRPSNTGTDNGVMGVKDLRLKYKA